MDNQDIIGLAGTGMNSEDSPEYVYQQHDIIRAFNMRFSGTAEQEAGNGTNIESSQLITISAPDGINKGIGGGSFEDVGLVAFSRYNSAGNNQIVLYNKSTQTEQVIFEDITDTNGQVLFPLNPQKYLKFLLINKMYMVWVADDIEVGYTNLNTLKSGGYGTVLWEDISLLKPQCMPPPTGVYGSDNGQPANYLYGKLPQFAAQYVNADFNYSAWSTRSKRIVPYQQNTPVSGSDVTKNNYIVVSVFAGSIRAATLNIACRFDNDIFDNIKSVDRTYFTALPNTTVDVDTEVFEAYNPATNIYSFAFYNNELSVAITPTETDLTYDYIWPSGAIEKINGNIIGLADFKTLYERPNTSVTVAAIGYNPNIDIPAGTFPDPLTAISSFPGASGSGAGNHKRIMSITIGGTPHTGDVIIVIMADIRDAASTHNRSYTVPSIQDGSLIAVVQSLAEEITNASYAVNPDNSYTITFTGDPYYGLQTYAVQLFFSGAAVANSIPTVLDNALYQLALSFRDYKSRFLPLDTNNQFILTTPSYAQVYGQAVQITWNINNVVAPVGAVDAQWLITKPPVNNVVDIIAVKLDFKGAWNAYANTPLLAVNTGTVGYTYQITTPAYPGDNTHYTNLGNNPIYKTGDYITYNGQSWDIIPKEFGDLTTTGNIVAFSLNSLNLFNSQYASLGVNTVLSYSFSNGDRCTLHYYIDGGTKVFINNPCVNLSVFGYDAGTYIVKVEKSATFDMSVLAGKNTFLRLYSPAPLQQGTSAVQNATVFREIGERITITNGNFDQTTGIIYDGGAYYKTRQFDDGLHPYGDPPISVLATDLNYSDFYPSQFSSFGRPRTYLDELERTERKASVIPSQNYILGSKNNGLNRFYQENIYGEGDGQTSSSFGAIGNIWQRGDILVVLQEQGIFYIPVNIAWTQLNDQLTGQSISEKLLNNGRYETNGVGIGLAKEAFCYNENDAWLVDPHRGEVYEMTVGGVNSINYKMDKYLKRVLQIAYSQNKKIVLFYNRYYRELMVCIETEGGILSLFPFNTTDWNPFETYTIVPSDVTATNNGAHSTVAYNSGTGMATYTPGINYVGNDVASFTFNSPNGSVTKNVCLNWTAGSAVVNPFSFTPRTGQPISTLISSNTIGVSGNTIPSPISITGDPGFSYSINGGAFTAIAGTVNAGDNVQVRVTSSPLNVTDTSCTLTIDGQSATFTVTTEMGAGTNNFTISAQYGFSFQSIYNVLGTTGVPAAFTLINVTPGNSMSAAYTTVTTGGIGIGITGSAAIPGHIRVALYVAGAFVSSVNTPMPGTYALNLPFDVNDPTTILIAVETF